MRIIFFLMLAASCASHLKEKVDANIAKGDSKDKVLAVLGQPSQISGGDVSPGWVSLVYETSADKCYIDIADSVVKTISCDDNSDHQNKGLIFLGKFLQGVGDSMQHKRTVSCTTVTHGDTSDTTCSE